MSCPNYSTQQLAYPGYAEKSDQNIDFDNAFSDKTVRQGFIRKVYSILSLQLLVSFSSVILFSNSDQMKLFARQNAYLMIILFLVIICTICPMIYAQSLRKKPYNYILLTIFTLAESIMLGFLGATTRLDIVLITVFITTGVVIGLTLFAFQTKLDLTALNGIMLCVLLVFSFAGLCFMFFPRAGIVNIVYSSIGSLILSIYIIIHTQSIVGGGDRK